MCLVFGFTAANKAFAQEESLEEAVAEAAAEQAEDDEEPSFMREMYQPVEPEPVVEAAAPEPVIEETPVIAEAPSKIKKCKASQESDAKKFRCGIRGGLGVSAFEGHKAIYTESFGSHAVVLGAFVSASTGLVFMAPVSKRLNILWETQYSLYTAHGEFTLKTKGADFGDLNQAGVELHTFEMPILLHFDIGQRYYAELGPQAGMNFYSKIYANNELKKPYLNLFAAGPALGFGVKLNDAAAVGVRGYYNMLEYAENSNGRPWTVQGSVTSFFKCKSKCKK